VSHTYQHTDVKRFVCRHCGVRFSSNFKHREHLIEEHDEGGWYVCDVCEKRYPYPASLRAHRQVHEAVKPYACSECPKRFCHVQSLKLHQLAHLGIMNFACGFCGRLFVRKCLV